jgi:hypothetical protein
MPVSDEAAVRLLGEVRDLQREQHAWSRESARKSLDAQHAALELARELRDAQREHLAWAREVAQRSMQAQQTGIDLARRSSRFYRIVVSVAALLVIGLLALLYHLT